MEGVKEFNYRTFGQYIGGTAGQQLRFLYLGSNAEITRVDFDQLMTPNIEELSAPGCVVLTSIANIPRSVSNIHVPHTGIRRGSQLHFKNQGGNKLNGVTCNADASAEKEFDELLKSVYPKWERRSCSKGIITMYRS